MLVLEALRARYGDALLLRSGTRTKPRLTVIDGGPAGVYGDALRPRLDALRAERGLDAATPLDVDLMMVSHIDDDHVSGLLGLAQKLNDRRESGQPLPWRIRRFWHNSFDDLLDNDDLQLGGGGSALSPASLGDFLAPAGSAILASVKQGRELRKLLDALTLGGNPPFRGLVQSDGAAKPVAVGDLRITVIAPRKAELAELQKKWNKEIKPLLAKEQSREGRAELAAYVDTSVHNLSSVVVLVESQGKRILLTGDGRGDHTLEGLKAAKLLKGGDSLVWFYLAMVHWQLGDKEEARKWYDQALQRMELYDPETRELKRSQAEAAKLLGSNAREPSNSWLKQLIKRSLSQ